MKKTLLSLVILCLAASHCFAQDDDTNVKLSAGVDEGIAIGPQSGAYLEVTGLSLKLEAPVNNTSLRLVFTTGYTGYISKGGYSTGYYASSTDGSGSYTNGSIASFIPVEAGAKFYITSKIFIEGDVGASFSLSNTSAQNVTLFNENTSVTTYSNNAKKIALIYAPVAGISIPIRSSFVDFSLRYESRVDSGNSFNQVAFGAAFRFGL